MLYVACSLTAKYFYKSPLHSWETMMQLTTFSVKHSYSDTSISAI